MVKMIRHRAQEGVPHGSTIAAYWLLSQYYDGVEVDLRMCNTTQDLYLEHDNRDRSVKAPLFRTLCASAQHLKEASFFVDIKQKGLLDTILKHAVPPNMFFMGVPGEELHAYCSAGLKVFGRISEHEVQCCGMEYGVLIDSFLNKPTGIMDQRLETYGEDAAVALIGSDLRDVDAFPDGYTPNGDVQFLITKALPAP